MIELAIILAAMQVEVDSNLLLATCFVETGFRNVKVLDDGGSPSYGVCQVKLLTAKSIDEDATPKRLMNPDYNALIAAHYLKRMIKRFNGYTWRGVGAYNAGPTKVSKWLKAHGKPLNQGYIRKVKRVYKNYNRQ